jgi:glutathione S-transferase
MMQLHYAPATASMIPHLLLEEMGATYLRVDVDRENGGHKTAAYLKLNPNGLIPVLTDGDFVLYETAAIVMHLSDTHAAAQLLPAVGTAQRAHAVQWLMWLTNTLQSALIVYFYPERWLSAAQASVAPDVQRQAEAKVAGLLAQLDAVLACSEGPWFLGSSYSVLDAYVFTLCRWTRGFANEQPARAWPHIGPYLQRMLERPAVQRVLGAEELARPWV